MLRVAPKHEAARRHYYRLPPESGLPPSFAEDVIGSIESLGAAAISRFEREAALDRSDREGIARFLALQHRRTPRGRRELRHMDEVLSAQLAELRASDADAVREALEADKAPVTEGEVEQAQREILEDLRTGQLVLESTPDREIAMMFMGLEPIALLLVTEFDWLFLRVPDDLGEVVLPDVGLTLFDPTPPFPESGTGFASSADSETVLHLSPRLVLVLHPGEGFGWVRDASAEDVERINFRACASSESCIYGSSEPIVRKAIERAGIDPVRIARLRPRPGRIWIAESDEGLTSGPADFIGYSTQGTTIRRFNVSEDAVREAQEPAGPSRPPPRRRHVWRRKRA